MEKKLAKIEDNWPYDDDQNPKGPKLSRHKYSESTPTKTTGSNFIEPKYDSLNYNPNIYKETQIDTPYHQENRHSPIRKPNKCELCPASSNSKSPICYYGLNYLNNKKYSKEDHQQNDSNYKMPEVNKNLISKFAEKGTKKYDDIQDDKFYRRNLTPPSAYFKKSSVEYKYPINGEKDKNVDYKSRARTPLHMSQTNMQKRLDKSVPKQVKLNNKIQVSSRVPRHDYRNDSSGNEASLKKSHSITLESAKRDSQKDAYQNFTGVNQTPNRSKSNNKACFPQQKLDQFENGNMGAHNSGNRIRISEELNALNRQHFICKVDTLHSPKKQDKNSSIKKAG